MKSPLSELLSSGRRICRLTHCLREDIRSSASPVDRDVCSAPFKSTTLTLIRILLAQLKAPFEIPQRQSARAENILGDKNGLPLWWKPPRGCTADKIVQRVTCPAMEAELGRGRQREKLKTDLDTAAAELSKIQPAKVANSDAKALARYLAAIGVDIGTDRLNDLLVLLAVLTIEAGGGLSLALGMALGSSAAIGQGERTPAELADTPEMPLVATLAGQESHSGQGAATAADHGPPLRPAAPVMVASVAEPALLTCLRSVGGSVESLRKLADHLGRPRSTITAEVHKLAMAGLLTLARGRHGTVISLAGAARPN